MPTIPTIFDTSEPGRIAGVQTPKAGDLTGLPAEALRVSKPVLPEVSELQAVRHFTKLSQQNFRSMEISIPSVRAR